MTESIVSIDMIADNLGRPIVIIIVLCAITYTVPTTLPVFASVWFILKFLANPKSAIFGFISTSKRMLLALRSRCTTVSRES
ncbi:hypothetical protein BRARA_C04664 [Brassica rapa]|uniref:Uncharacterized protein n=1 Tax=Brassica campestris TaxID=3711 RepID=A0A398ABZ1_BRACM|nr:hypothetical protein BRARA_C04664 [Brassica rapa]